MTLVFGVLATLALAFSWLAPNHYPPWTSFHGEAAAFAALVLFCAARALSSRPFAGAGVPFAVAGGLLLIIAIQWLAGQIAYSGDAFLSGMYVAGWALSWWLGINSHDRDSKPEAAAWFAAIVVTAAATAVLVALLQWLRMESVLGTLAAERDPDMRPYSNLGQPNHLASLVLIATVLTVLLHALGRLKSWQAAGLVLWFSLGLTLSESRSGLLSALCLGALAVIKRRDVAHVLRMRWVAGWCALLLVLAMAWPFVNEALYLHAPRGALAGKDSARQVIWRQCVAGIEASPWVGYGWRQSMVGQKVGADTIPGWQMADYAHNAFLDLFLWVGLPLGLLIAGTVLWWLLRLFMRLRGSTEVLLFASVLPVLVHSFFEFPFAYSYFLFPAAWSLGFLSRGQRVHELPAGRPGADTRRRWCVGVAIALFAAAAASLASEYLEAEEDYRVMRFELRRVGRRPADHQAPQLHLLTQLDETLKLGRIVPRPHMPAEEIERLRVGSVRLGWATLHLGYALTLGMNGNPEQASKELHLLRNSYGEPSYRTAQQIWRDMKAQHPELSAVRVP